MNTDNIGESLVNAAKEAERLRDMMMEAAVLGAMASDAIHGRQSDEISEREAFLLYGSAWVKDRHQRGMIHCSRTGRYKKSKKVYSRFEIEALKRSEKAISGIYSAALAKASSGTETTARDGK